MTTKMKMNTIAKTMRMGMGMGMECMMIDMYNP